MSLVINKITLCNLVFRCVIFVNICLSYELGSARAVSLSDLNNLHSGFDLL